MSKISLFSNASDLRKQQEKMYNSNFTDCSFAFEFIAMNTSTTYGVDPLFERIVNNVGFPEVDSVGFLNVPSTNFSRLFYIKTSDVDFITGTGQGLTNTSYGVIGNPELGVYDGVIPFKTFPNNLSYAYSKIKGGFANPALDLADNTLLYQDYVRYTAKSITGGYALSDIFSNEQELLNGVTNMDPFFNENLTSLLLNASNCENVSSGISSDMKNYNFVISCKTLVESLLADATNPNPANVSSYTRGNQFLKDLQEQSKIQEELNIANGNSSGFSTKKYWVIFHPGDVMAVRLNYTPKNGNGNLASNEGGTIGGNAIYNRSYKIYLNMK